MDDWDQVDEASWESFPASDPPSWSSYRVVGSAEDKITPEVAPKRRRWPWVIGAAAVTAGLVWIARRAIRR